jgi:hypothetical protein
MTSIIVASHVKAYAYDLENEYSQYQGNNDSDAWS